MLFLWLLKKKEVIVLSFFGRSNTLMFQQQKCPFRAKKTLTGMLLPLPLIIQSKLCTTRSICSQQKTFPKGSRIKCVPNGCALIRREAMKNNGFTASSRTCIKTAKKPAFPAPVGKAIFLSKWSRKTKLE